MKVKQLKEVLADVCDDANVTFSTVVKGIRRDLKSTQIQITRRRKPTFATTLPPSLFEGSVIVFLELQ
jgi:hypothetical protein